MGGRDGWCSLVRILLPALGQIDAWLRTSWAEQGQISSPRAAALLMSKPEPLQGLEVSPLAGHMKQLSITILKWIPSAGGMGWIASSQTLTGTEPGAELFVNLFSFWKKLKPAVLHSIASM